METNKQTILIVDDDELYRKVFSSRLKDEGYLILEEKDGKDGLATALVKKPDVILLDVKMPNMDGLTMLDKLREDEWGKNVRVIILTNVSDNETLSRAILNKSFVYLVKSDMSMDELVDKVKKALIK